MRRQVFIPHWGRNSATFYVRTTAASAGAYGVVRNEVRQLDASMPVYAMKTLEAQLDETLLTDRLIALLAAGFGLLATVLASIGLYGVMAFVVARRRKELGIRLALGAEPGGVIWLVMKEVLLLLSIGLAVGIPAAMALGRFVSAQLYGIEAGDPWIAVATMVLLDRRLCRRRFDPGASRQPHRSDPGAALRVRSPTSGPRRSRIAGRLSDRGFSRAPRGSPERLVLHRAQNEYDRLRFQGATHDLSSDGPSYLDHFRHRPRAGARASPTGRSCRTKPCSTSRRCCASTPAILRATRPCVAEYLKGVLDKEGIPAQIVGSDPKRSNLVARLKGNGKKRPLLIMGHSDVVTVDEAKWKFPPFSATRDGGYVYGRGTVDDKDNLTAALMTMLLLKRQNVPLDRDVIFLSEAGEEGSSGHRHRLHGERALPDDRRRILPRRRRRRRCASAAR